jgi:hypothetical protein
MTLSIKETPNLIAAKLQPLARYKILLFAGFVALMYGYLLLQINQAASTQASTDQAVVAGQKSPHIDEVTAQKLQQLQDNSVSVKALFNEARTNPFD